MIAAQRRAHRAVWAVLVAALPLGIVAALAVRPAGDGPGERPDAMEGRGAMVEEPMPAPAEPGAPGEPGR